MSKENLSREEIDRQNQQLLDWWRKTFKKLTDTDLVIKEREKNGSKT